MEVVRLGSSCFRLASVRVLMYHLLGSLGEAVHLTWVHGMLSVLYSLEPSEVTGPHQITLGGMTRRRIF